jgi:hypothetical protein
VTSGTLGMDEQGSARPAAAIQRLPMHVRHRGDLQVEEPDFRKRPRVIAHGLAPPTLPQSRSFGILKADSESRARCSFGRDGEAESRSSRSARASRAPVFSRRVRGPRRRVGRSRWRQRAASVVRRAGGRVGQARSWAGSGRHSRSPRDDFGGSHRQLCRPPSQGWSLPTAGWIGFPARPFAGTCHRRRRTMDR